MKENSQPVIESLEDYLLYYCVKYKKRRTHLEKKIAEKFICDEYSSIGYELSEVNVKEKMLNSKILIAGSVKDAKRIYVAPFDTPRRTIQLKYKFFPFDDDKNKKQEKIDIALVALLMLSLIVIIFYLHHRIFKEMNWVLIVVLILALWIMNQWLNNGNNFNKSSASLALINYIAKRSNKRDACFIFIDNNSENNFGLKCLYERFNNFLNNKQVIYIDCIADGEELVLAYTDKCKAKINNQSLDIYEKVYKRGKYPGVFKINQQIQILISGTRVKQDFYIENIRSGKDTKVDVARLKKIADWLLDMKEGEEA